MPAHTENLTIPVTPDQKRELRQRAKKNGTSMASEVRKAIDRHLDAISNDELARIDLATRSAERDIRWMIDRLTRTNRRLDSIEAERRKLRAAVIVPGT